MKSEIPMSIAPKVKRIYWTIIAFLELIFLLIKNTFFCKGKFVSEFSCQFIKQAEVNDDNPIINKIELRLNFSPQIKLLSCINWLENIPAQKTIQIAKKYVGRSKNK